MPPCGSDVSILQSAHRAGSDSHAIGGTACDGYQHKAAKLMGTVGRRNVDLALLTAIFTLFKGVAIGAAGRLYGLDGSPLVLYHVDGVQLAFGIFLPFVVLLTERLAVRAGEHVEYSQSLALGKCRSCDGGNGCGNGQLCQKEAVLKSVLVDVLDLPCKGDAR